jgi:ribonuclease Z
MRRSTATWLRCWRKHSTPPATTGPGPWRIIAYHTSPVEAAAIAKEAGVPLLVFTHEVPPLRNGLMRRMFMRGVANARGDGKIILGKDGLLISLPKGTKDIQTKQLY